jgi:hypothetical protein
MRAKTLRTLSIIYLMLPNFVFYYSWTTTSIAVAGIVLLVYILFDEFKEPSFGTEAAFDLKDILIVLTFALILTAISGINGYFYQSKDYWAHNAKFQELFTYRWPVRLPDDTSAVISYYYGFYVVPSLFSKLAGHISEVVIFFWTFIGLALGIGWLYLSVHKKILYVWLILCLGDLPRVFMALLNLFSGSLYSLDEFGIENWSVFENLFWVPNQVIPALIIAGMFMYVLLKNGNISLLVLPIALSFWWAIFPAFVGGLLVAILVIREWIDSRFNIEWDVVIRKVFLPFIACVPVLILFFSHETIPVSGFLWEFDLDMNNMIKMYAANILINVALFFGTYLYIRKVQGNVLKPLPFYISIFLCLVFPLYRMGEVNDLLIRGMMPVLVIVGIYLFHPLTELTIKQTWKIVKSSGAFLVFALLLVSSSLLGAVRLWRAASVNQLSDPTFKPMPYDVYPNVYEALKAEWSQEGADQYTGDINSFYEKYIAPQHKSP